MTSDETSPSLAAIVAQVDPSLPEYRHQTSPDGMMTIVFTDIEGSTEMMERLGERDWLEMLLAHNDLVRGLVAEHGGDVVKSQGDGFMLAFRSASSGLACAVGLKRAVRRFNAANLERSLRMRIGAHTGNLFELEGDFLGRAVVLAARITGRARGGEVLVSAASKQYTEDLGRWDYGEPTLLSLKGWQARSVCTQSTGGPRECFVDGRSRAPDRLEVRLIRTAPRGERPGAYGADHRRA